MNNAQGGVGALLSGLAGGYSTGTKMQRNMAEIQKQPQGLGLPGGQTMSATGAVGLPQTAPALPSTPAAKAATDSGGNWQTIANLFTPQSGQQA